MLCLTTHHFPFFKKKEVWFYNGEHILEEGYTTYCYVLGDFNLKFDKKLEEFTTTIDLSENEKEIFKKINRTFKYHIKRGAHFRYEHNLSPTIDECKKLIITFNKFAAWKNITTISKKRIEALQRSGNLAITTALDQEKEIVKHVYLFDNERTVLLHTFHEAQTDHPQRGFANKCLHWKDLLLFKERGLKTYDFGGIDLQKVPGISNFKLSYGGKIESVNSYTRINNSLKHIFNLYKKIRPTT